MTQFLYFNILYYEQSEKKIESFNDIELKAQNKRIKAKNQRYRHMKIQNTKRQQPNFPKEQVENADLYKPVLNKTMTTCK